MTGRTHDLAAFTALSYIVATNPLPETTLATVLVAMGANMVGGIAPDVDQSTAPFWRNLPIGNMFGRFFGRLLGGHRFLSHSILGIILFGVLWELVLLILTPSFPTLDMDIIWWAFMIGFISHLVMDTFSKEGVPWLLPIPVKIGIPPTKHFRITTGGIIEKIFIFPGLIILNIFIYYVYYDKLLIFLNQYVK